MLDTDSKIDEKSHIFISHSSYDARIVKELRQELENLGLKVWDSSANIPGGAHYVTKISIALKSSSAVIVLLSENSMQSLEVLNEARMAQDNKVPLIPINLEESIKVSRDLPDGWDYMLQTVQLLNYKNGKSAAKQICDALGINVDSADKSPLNTDGHLASGDFVKRNNSDQDPQFQIRKTLDSIRLPKISFEPLVTFLKFRGLRETLSRVDLKPLALRVTKFLRRLSSQLLTHRKPVFIFLGIVAIAIPVFLLFGKQSGAESNSTQGAPQETTSSASSTSEEVTTPLNLAGKWITNSYYKNGSGWYFTVVSTSEKVYTGTFYFKPNKAAAIERSAVTLDASTENEFFVKWKTGKKTPFTLTDLSNNKISNLKMYGAVIDISGCLKLLPGATKAENCYFYRTKSK